MFVISVKSNKLKGFCAVALAAVFVTLGALYYVSLKAEAPVSKMGEIDLKVSDAQERVHFFSQFGLTVKEEPAEVKEVVIPAEFDDVYSKYNELQKAQGFDLTRYAGARVKHWSYEITNYEGYENREGVIRGNILVYEDTVIACDISSTEMNGFMKGLLQ